MLLKLYSSHSNIHIEEHINFTSSLTIEWNIELNKSLEEYANSANEGQGERERER